MTGSGRIGTRAAILAVSMTLFFSCPAMAARGLNYESLRSQGMALRDEIRSVPCWKNKAELEALEDREGIWQDHVTNLEKSDPDIRHSGGGWRASRLDSIWNDIVRALHDLRGKPCPSGGTPLRTPHNLPVSNNDDWGNSDQHASVPYRPIDPYPGQHYPYPDNGQGKAPDDGPKTGMPSGYGSYPMPGGH